MSSYLVYKNSSRLRVAMEAPFIQGVSCYPDSTFVKRLLPLRSSALGAFNIQTFPLHVQMSFLTVHTIVHTRYV